MSILTRPATLGDARTIATIHVRSWQIGYAEIMPAALLEGLSVDARETRWRDQLARGDGDLWLAEEDGRALGWILTGPSRDDDRHASTGELHALYVHPDSWRRGAGALLWRGGEERLRQAAMTEVTAWVLAENERALRFYRSVGFAIDPDVERTVAMGGVQLAHLRVRKRLP